MPRPSNHYTVVNKRTNEERIGFCQFDDNPDFKVLSFDPPLPLDAPFNSPAQSSLETFSTTTLSRVWWGQGDGGDCLDWYLKD